MFQYSLERFSLISKNLLIHTIFIHLTVLRLEHRKSCFYEKLFYVITEFFF